MGAQVTHSTPFKRTMKKFGRPRKIVTDGLRALFCGDEGGRQRRSPRGRWPPQQSSGELASAVSTTRARDAALSSMKTLQKFSSVHGQVHNHFNQERDLVTRSVYKQRRSAEWRALAA